MEKASIPSVSPSSATMDDVVNQIRQLASNADASTRHEISHKLHALAATIETPREIMMRYAYSVSSAASPDSEDQLTCHIVYKFGNMSNSNRSKIVQPAGR